MTKQASEFDWKQLFEERGYTAEPVEGPVDRGDDGTAPLAWFQLLTRFTQRGFLRVIAADADSKLKVELQVALPDGEDSGYLEALTRHLAGRGLDVEVVSEKRPWTLDLVLGSDERLGALIDDLEQLSAHVRRAEETGDIRALADEWSEGGTPASDEPETTDEDEPKSEQIDTASEPSSASSSPFESIGDDQPDEDAVPPTETTDENPDDDASTNPEEPPGRARLGAFEMRVDDGAVVLRANPDATATASALEHLGRSLRSKLENRFDLVARSTDVLDDAVELHMTPSELGATYGMPTGELCEDVAQYLDRQRQLADLGVSFDKMSPRRERTSRRPTEPSRPNSSVERPRERDRGSEPRAEVEESDDGVVFGFGEEDIAAASPSESSLDPGDYSDPRVMREDADTALVDVVLRHPGYSDRNMRQVLSILLDVDYYRAGKLIDQAPCVIAWGVSQERAREFKRVIEQSGGRVTLVEPDTLADAE